MIRGAKKLDVYITKTKNGLPRTLRIPVPLLDRIQRYVISTRAAIVRECRLRGNSADKHAVFLSDRGTRVSRKTVHKNFHNACAEAHIVARFHDLRHTFAIHRLRELEAHKNDDPDHRYVPIKVLQRDLGHLRLSSTQIYVDAMDTDLGSIEQSMQTLLDLTDA